MRVWALERLSWINQYDAATMVGPRKNVANAAVAKFAKEILQEALPHLALKHSPRSFGARGFFEAASTVALVSALLRAGKGGGSR